MATFTPPSHTEYFAAAGQDRLWSRVTYDRGDAILVEGNTVTRLQVVDSDRLIAAEADGNGFHSSHTYTTVVPETELLLASAGYEASDNLLDPEYPAWLFS